MEPFCQWSMGKAPDTVLGCYNLRSPATPWLGIVWLVLFAAIWILPDTDALHPCTQKLFSNRPLGRISLSQRMVLTTPEAIFEQASTTTLLDDLIDESVRTSARRPIMMQFDPDKTWIWKRWKGTIFSETWDACVTKMVYASIVFIICRSVPQIKPALSGFNILWAQLLSVTTFTLTFFVNQSYALWRKCSELSRRLQGRLHDLDMTLAAHAARTHPNRDEPSTYTQPARRLLELVSRYVRLFNLLTYASFTRSHRPILTPAGMRRLVDRGLMTSLEREVLIGAEIPATQRHNAVLMWIVRTFVEGKAAGHFIGGSGFEQQFIEKAHVCRSSYGAIGDELNGRMPLAYVHIVQVLVDMVLWMYPFMAYSSGMSGLLCVMGTGLLTLGYQGLFDLAKQFLDPYDNENYGKGEDPLVVDTLIAETNAGSIRWMNSLDMMPVSNERIRKGDLDDFLLPLRGYSVEELATWEIQKKEREEREAMEQKLHEEMAARMARIQEAAECLIPLKLDSQHARPVEPMSVVLDKTQVMPLVSSSVIDSREVVLGVAELVLDDGLIKTLQSSLIPEGTALASSYSAETFSPIDPAEFNNLGNSDDIEAHVDAFANFSDEKTYCASELGLEQLEEMGDKQTKLEPMLQISQNEEILNNMTQIVETNVETNGSQGFIAVQSQKGTQDDEANASGYMSNKSESDDDGTTTGGQQGEKSPTLDQANETFTFEDYERQIQEILNIEKEELLETEAILNARPGADLEFPEKEVDNESLAGKPDHDIDKLEPVGDQQMSESETSAQPGPIVDEYQCDQEVIGDHGTEYDDELLETEAILNAPPGADGFDDPEEERNANPVLNSTQAEDLSVLEMDEPSLLANDAREALGNNIETLNSLSSEEKDQAESLRLNGGGKAPSIDEV